jgi:hypothetical protein
VALTAHYGPPSGRVTGSATRAASGNVGGVKSISFPPQKAHGSVIIRGHVFTWAEKQPFVASGKSVLGAMEYNTADDTTKCHECGEWFRFLGSRIHRNHGIGRAEYNATHGLSRNTAISGLGLRAKRRDVQIREAKQGRGTSDKRFIAGRASGKGKVKGRTFGPHPVEVQNKANRCAAQLLYQVQRLAATIGRTPGRDALVKAGINPHVLEHRFGSVPAAMNACGLEPNQSGYTMTPLPVGFPSKAEIQKRFNERMPWPEDYSKPQTKSGSSLA